LQLDISHFLSSASNKVDDFQPIILSDPHLIPTSSGKDLSVEFYGDSVSFEIQSLDDAAQG
jgi:hypothetical protein